MHSWRVQGQLYLHATSLSRHPAIRRPVSCTEHRSNNGQPRLMTEVLATLHDFLRELRKLEPNRIIVSAPSGEKHYGQGVIQAEVKGLAGGWIDSLHHNGLVYKQRHEQGHRRTERMAFKVRRSSPQLCDLLWFGITLFNDAQ
jgi:hypothetical protein